jgi:hypothetical protein
MSRTNALAYSDTKTEKKSFITLSPGGVSVSGQFRRGRDGRGSETRPELTVPDDPTSSVGSWPCSQSAYRGTPRGWAGAGSALKIRISSFRER